MYVVALLVLVGSRLRISKKKLTFPKWIYLKKERCVQPIQGFVCRLSNMLQFFD